ncbi:methyltransferase [Conidiobolus coronatus NRRL 28638]|uniref:tRNA N(3)-methylcytidine methyltransferase n=1 Tax=Conidiobolus coronatus (strain ATCC 28846 / CBS 209.66 / NRRL 28638) TaxID=796925 RepID=A0A137P0C9_CONC2|nr:methyltransferase [Conidiobolus coronatus NRRL 28638]|eukprot:KXN68319.1 methyltransferase [Conidiobolus coronatus NRRL 28638]
MTKRRDPTDELNPTAEGENKTETVEFGNRFLTDKDQVFEHNACNRDNVEPSAEHLEHAKNIVLKQAENPVEDSEKVAFDEKANEFWNKFYNNNENKFFKNRNWLNLEFPEIFIGKEGDELEEDFNILELGCGVGNTTFPLLEANPNPKFKVFTTDFSSTAIDVLKQHPLYDNDRCKAFVWDMTATELPEIIEPNSLDCILMIFAFSAVHPKNWKQTIDNLLKMLKPGGQVLFRDYGRFDLAQLRFKKGRYVQDNFYVRGDGTQVYFFTEDELREIFDPSKFTEKQLGVDRRLIVNRAQKVQMHRVWIQGKWIKKADEE